MNKEEISIVIPAFNEGEKISQTIYLAMASAREAEITFEIIIVNDGSTDDTENKLNEFTNVSEINVISIPNSGRITARLTGVQNAKFENVLLLDARVGLDFSSLKNLKELRSTYPKSIFWNGHVNFDQNSMKIPFVSIWQTLVSVSWSQYLSNPKTTFFTPDNFDLFPKGTGLFLAPQSDLLKGLRRLSIQEANSHSLVSDDTKLIREFAERSEIWISPQFSGTYFPRVKFNKFIRNLYFRGQTFYDSYERSPSFLGKAVRFSRTIIPIAIVLLGYMSFSDPITTFRVLFSLLALLSVAFAVFSFRSNGNVSRVLKETSIFPIFVTVFALGYIKSVFRKITFSNSRENS